jgi:prevent-host-death family protein
MNETLSIREARTRLCELADEAQRLGRRFTIPRRGKASVVLMSASEFQSWAETIEVVSDRSILRQLRASASDIRRGRTVSFASLRDRKRP